MSIRPISRIGSATTAALRGTSGVGGAERLAQIVSDYSASSAKMASVGSAGINGATGSTSTTGTQGVSFAQALANVSGADLAALSAELREAEQRSMEALKTLAAERDGASTRVVEDLRTRVEDALENGSSVMVGHNRGHVVAQPRAPLALPAPEQPRGLLTDGSHQGELVPPGMLDD